VIKIVLASQSPQRIALLEQIGLKFEKIPSNVDEEKVPRTRPTSYVKRLAKLKAKAVAKQIDEGIVIGADTVVCIDDRILDKPQDTNDAINTLRLLDGRVHRVISGICVINKYSGTTFTKSITTKVKFKKLDNKLIEWYIGTGESFDKAGSYAIQGKGAVLIEWIRGDYSNVVGMPVAALTLILKNMGAFAN
jgi:septum formation protein